MYIMDTREMQAPVCTAVDGGMHTQVSRWSWSFNLHGSRVHTLAWYEAYPFGGKPGIGEGQKTHWYCPHWKD